MTWIFLAIRAIGTIFSRWPASKKCDNAGTVCGNELNSCSQKAADCKLPFKEEMPYSLMPRPDQMICQTYNKESYMWIWNDPTGPSASLMLAHNVKCHTRAKELHCASRSVIKPSKWQILKRNPCINTWESQRHIFFIPCEKNEKYFSVFLSHSQSLWHSFVSAWRYDTGCHAYRKELSWINQNSYCVFITIVCYFHD